MSVRVLVVPEDPANNGYILKPLISRMLAECGKPGAVVTVLTNPRAKGYTHAKALLREQLLDRYRHMDLLLLAGHREKLGDRRWKEVREDTSVKENVFEPFLVAHGNPKAPGKGRDVLMQATLAHYRSLLGVCEELAELEERIRTVLG